MTTFWILIALAFICFFISGIITGYVLLSQRFNKLLQRYNDLRDEHDSLCGALEKKNSVNTILTKDHTALVDTYESLRQLSIYQQKKIDDLQEQYSRIKDSLENTAILESTKSEYDEKVIQLNDQNQRLMAQVNLLQRKIVDAEQYREYVIKYNESMELQKELRNQNIYLRDEITKLYSAGISLGNFGIKPLVFESKSGGNNLSVVFERILIKNASLPGHRGAVLSDENGLVVASTSQYSEELAAITALFQQCQRTICENIAFDSISKITFVNSNNLFLTIAPMIINRQKVYYSGLTQGRVMGVTPANKVTNAIIYTR